METKNECKKENICTDDNFTCFHKGYSDNDGDENEDGEDEDDNGSGNGNTHILAEYPNDDCKNRSIYNHYYNHSKDDDLYDDNHENVIDNGFVPDNLQKKCKNHIDKNSMNNDSYEVLQLLKHYGVGILKSESNDIHDEEDKDDDENMSDNRISNDNNELDMLFSLLEKGHRKLGKEETETLAYLQNATEKRKDNRPPLSNITNTLLTKRHSEGQRLGVATNNWHKLTRHHSAPERGSFDDVYSLPSSSIRCSLSTGSYTALEPSRFAEGLIRKTAAARKSIIVDCRYPYEFDAGHIKNSINIYQEDDMYEEFFLKRDPNLNKSMNSPVVFYCEYSKLRAPRMAYLLRQIDRDENSYDFFSPLSYKEVYVLDRGFKEFRDKYNLLCEPKSFISMEDPKYKDVKIGYDSLAKSNIKSWSIPFPCTSINTTEQIYYKLRKCNSFPSYFNSNRMLRGFMVSCKSMPHLSYRS